MIKTYTDIEQANALVEKGLNPKTADMYYIRHYGEYYAHFNNEPYIGEKVAPCWSMGRLMALLPDEICIDAESRRRKQYTFSIEKFEQWRYNTAYARTDHITNEIDVLWEDTQVDSTLDSLVLLMQWILQNGYQDKEVIEDIINEEYGNN